jgi:hypothetical protein
MLCSSSLVALTLAVSMGGCKLFSEKTQTDPGPRYPDSMTKSEVVDIQVFRDSTTLKFTNTTTEDFGASIVWINQRYSQPIPGLASGETIEMDLKLFVDDFGETFRAGGFYSQRVPAPVVLCQLETQLNGEQQLVGLVVVENNMD